MRDVSALAATVATFSFTGAAFAQSDDGSISAPTVGNEEQNEPAPAASRFEHGREAAEYAVRALQKQNFEEAADAYREAWDRLQWQKKKRSNMPSDTTLTAAHNGTYVRSERV